MTLAMRIAGLLCALRVLGAVRRAAARVAVGCGALVAALVAQVGLPASLAAQEGGQAEVVLWHSYRGREAEALEAVVDDFRARHAGLSVRVLAVPNEAYTNKLASAIPRGNGPDVFIGAHDQTGAWVDMKLLAPLDEAASVLEGFYPLTVEALRFEGRLYGLPLAFKSPVLVYNRALVSEPPQDTAALMAFLEGFDTQGGTRFGLVYQLTSMYYHSAWLHGFGGHLFDPETGRVDLANEGFAASLRFARALSRHLPHQADGARVKQLFNDGQAAMVIDGPWFLAQIDPGLDYGLAVLPWVSETRQWARPFVTAEGIFLSSQARRPEAARALMRHIATEGAARRALEGEQMVAWSAAWAEPALAQAPAQVAARRQVFIAQLEHGELMSNRPEMSSVWGPTEQALQKAMYGAPSGETPYWLLLAVVLLVTGVVLVVRGRDPSRGGGPRPALAIVGALLLCAVVPVVWKIVGLHGAGHDVDPLDALREAQLRYEMVQAPAAARANPAPYIALVGLFATALCALGVRRYRARARQGHEDPDNRVAALYVAPAGIAMLLLVVAPFVVGTCLSFFAWEGGEFSFVGLQNFERLLLGEGAPATDPLSFYYTLVVTILWTALNVFFHVAIGLVLALLLRDPWLRLRGFYRVLLIVPWAVPNYITALIWRGMFDSQFGAINGILASIGVEPVNWFDEFLTSFAANLVTNTWLGFPFMMVVTLGALQSIPRDLEDAAEVDGASRWQRFRHVTLPLLQPALVPAVILGSVWTFNMFNIIYLVSRGNPDSSTEILISEAYKWAFERQFQYGYAAAYATIVFVILVVYSRMTRAVLEGNSA